MAGKSKRASRAKPSKVDSRLDIQQMFAPRLGGSARRNALLEEARSLLSAGKVRESKKMLAHAEDIQPSLHALEGLRRTLTRQAAWPRSRRSAPKT